MYITHLSVMKKVGAMLQKHIFSWLNQINDPKIGDVLN